MALSYLSLNTYQNQLEPRNISKQVIFLMANVIDAWKYLSVFIVNIKQKD